MVYTPVLGTGPERVGVSSTSIRTNDSIAQLVEHDPFKIEVPRANRGGVTYCLVV